MPRAGKHDAKKTKKAKKKSIWSNFWVKFGAAFLATVLILGGGVGAIFGYIFGGLDVLGGLSDEEAGIQAQDYHSKEIVNIALFGIDSTDDAMEGRSDSIVIVTLDNKNKEIRLSAIERDTYVPIEGHGKDKINHAFAFGGAKLAIKTLNQHFGLDIKDYAVVNFNNMVKVIDALDGIRIDVPAEKINDANRRIRDDHTPEGQTPDLIEKSGEQLLTGTQVLALSRVRVVGGTEGRASMHETVLSACFDRIKEKNVLEYPEIARELLALVQTSLDAGEVTSLGIKVVTGGYKIRQEVFPLQQDWLSQNMINGIWYRTYNYETGNENIRNFIYKGILPEEEE